MTSLPSTSDMRIGSTICLSVSSLFLAILATPAAARATETADWSKPEQYVLVTATREPESAANILVPVAVIDRDDIDRSLAIDISQLLGQQAGIDITPYGGPGQTVSVFMRGTNSNHTVFLVDGIRINPGTIGVAAVWTLLRVIGPIVPATACNIASRPE